MDDFLEYLYDVFRTIVGFILWLIITILQPIVWALTFGHVIIWFGEDQDDPTL